MQHTWKNKTKSVHFTVFNIALKVPYQNWLSAKNPWIRGFVHRFHLFLKHNYIQPSFFTSSCSVIIENSVGTWDLNLPSLPIWRKACPETPASNSPLIHMFLLPAKEWWSDNVNLIYLWWLSLWKLGGKAWNEKLLDISGCFSIKKIVLLKMESHAVEK